MNQRNTNQKFPKKSADYKKSRKWLIISDIKSAFIILEQGQKQ